jgi:cephalosporin hydroxylase
VYPEPLPVLRGRSTILAVPDPPPTGLRGDADEIVNRFHRLYYGGEGARVVDWLGVRTMKCPLDLWMYQEILHRTRPDVIVETGTLKGGSALFLASMCDLIGHGRVVTIDVREWDRPDHPRITYLTGSSVDPAIVAQVREAVRPSAGVMVLLDADHSKEHVLAELRTYAPLVGEGHYLIAEDTNVNGHPVFPSHGPGPMEAVEAFLAEPAGQGFEVDRSCERFFLTMNPGGFLRRTAGAVS